MKGTQLSINVEEVQVLPDTKWRMKDMIDCNPNTHFDVIGVSTCPFNLEEELIVYSPHGSNRILHRTKKDFLNKFRQL